MAIGFVRTIPILRIFDVEKAKEFYGGYLGFRVDWEHRFPDVAPVYMQVSRRPDSAPQRTLWRWYTRISGLCADGGRGRVPSRAHAEELWLSPSGTGEDALEYHGSQHPASVRKDDLI